MTIEYNRVTWYSKLLAIVVCLLLIPIWTFYLGMRYEEAKQVSQTPETTVQF